MTERILVAGGAGFIGTNLTAALLDQGYDVVVLDNLRTGRTVNLDALTTSGRLVFRHGDINDPPGDLGSFNKIYNLACAASPVHYQSDPVDTLPTCVNGTHNLLALAEACGARFLMASTSEVYGDPLTHPQPEGYFGNVNPNGPRACYDEGKRAAETLCCDYRQRGVDVRIARIFNTYGPFMSPDDGRVVTNAVCQALAGHDITVYGDGTQTRSFCYIDDLVAGLMALMECGTPIDRPINLGNPDEVSINDMVAEVLRAVPGRSRIVHRPLPTDDPRRRCPDISRARELLGWEPKIAFPDGLGRTVQWLAGQTQPTIATSVVQPTPVSKSQARAGMAAE
ncbi:UDP-glucuronic acid decarboxylase family protein [Fodinicurvata sp. EGI_FJ10296]|uniref:UDP-glucuronic acid decarboxylase family protein n=1 Tax=Fodinicurvata sp. EGI_FJ10296 TaxID=3231908 RepID=UPI003453CDAC